MLVLNFKKFYKHHIHTTTFLFFYYPNGELAERTYGKRGHILYDTASCDITKLGDWSIHLLHGESY